MSSHEPGRSRFKHALRPFLFIWIWAAALLLSACGGHVDEPRPFQAHPPQSALRLLVAGDSTALGTGASDPARSLAGQIGAAHPDWLIDNLGRNGAKWADIAVQLREAPGRYDRVLLLGGGNDVIRLTGDETMRAQMKLVLALAQQRAPQVVLMPAGNVGNAPLFWWPVSRYMTHRARYLHALAAELSAGTGVRYVRLFKERGEDPFVAHAETLHAKDGLHPSDAGYTQWLEELRKQVPGWF